MKLGKWGPLAFASLLAGCSGMSSSPCGSDDAKGALANLLTNATEDAVRAQLESLSSLDAYDRSKLSAVLSRAEIDLSSVRTTQDDPDSSRQFCSATIKMTFPRKAILTIDDARMSGGLESRQQVANRAGLVVTPEGFQDDVEYSIQPTDDGSETIAETDSAGALIGVLGELFASYLLSEEIRSAKIEQDRIAAEEQALAKAEELEQQRMMDETEAAQVEYAKATAEEAVAANKLAAQRIAAVWQAIPADTRKSLASMQTAWNRKTNARCKVEAAGTSTIREEVRAAQLGCETQAMLGRARELERFASYGDAADAEAMIDQ